MALPLHIAPIGYINPTLPAMYKLSLLAFIAILQVHIQEPNPKHKLLQRKTHMAVHRAETLESVILRIYLETRTNIEFSSALLSPYRAKAANYKGASLGMILKEQLKDTPIKYRIKGNTLKLYAEKQPSVK